MKINLGENLRRLRGERGLTQERLAFELGVSPQAVSRWETGGALPDIALLPVIADFFDVTLDELMGRGPGCPPEELDKWVKMTSDLAHMGKSDEAIALARKIAKKYPRDEYVIMLLVNRLYAYNSDSQNYDDEMIDLCEKVRRIGKHPDMWVMATERLVKLYIRAEQRDKAHVLAGTLPSLFCGRELAVRDSLPDGEGKFGCCLNNIKILNLLLTRELRTASRLSDSAQRTKLDEAAEDIFGIIDKLRL